MPRHSARREVRPPRGGHAVDVALLLLYGWVAGWLSGLLVQVVLR
ncbi:hypothetical protein [Streptomyces hainanensis]|nr:hypothetical protein [Streptomyces hainanensis]